MQPYKSNAQVTFAVFHKHPLIKEPIFPPKPEEPKYPSNYKQTEHRFTIKNNYLCVGDINKIIRDNFPSASLDDVFIEKTIDDDDNDIFVFIYKQKIPLSDDEFNSAILEYNKEMENYNFLMSKYPQLIEDYDNSVHEYELQFANYKKNYFLNKLQEVEDHIKTIRK